MLWDSLAEKGTRERVCGERWGQGNMFPVCNTGRPECLGGPGGVGVAVGVDACW